MESEDVFGWLVVGAVGVLAAIVLGGLGGLVFAEPYLQSCTIDRRPEGTVVCQDWAWSDDGSACVSVSSAEEGLRLMRSLGCPGVK